MAFQFIPSNATSVDICVGVKNTLSNYIIMNETIGDEVDILEIPDQQGRTCQAYAYQRRYTLDFEAVGPVDDQPVAAGATFAWKTPDGDSMNYIIDSCTLASTYNDTAKWRVTGRAWINAAYHDVTDGQLPQ